MSDVVLRAKSLLQYATNFKLFTMRKFLFTFMAIALSLTVGQSQDLTGLDGKKALKKASRLLSAYNLDQTNNGDKLVEAKAVIEFASEQDEVKDDPKTWVTMGQVYNALINMDATNKILDPSYEAKYAAAGMMAFQANKKALDLDAGNKNALKGLLESISAISNNGISLYEQANFMEAFTAFRSVLDIHDILKANDYESPLDPEGEHDNQLYITGLAAMNAGQTSTAKSFITPLYEKGYDKPAVYDAMYKMTADEDMDAAAVILENARSKYPDDLGLLFTEINHYLKLDKIDVLSEKLELAIEKEPDNPSLYSTLGNIYDRIYQEKYEAGALDEAEDYFAKAKSNYEKAVEIKPDFTDAIYSIGALYYNKAAILTKEMNALANDYSADATKKFNDKKLEVEEHFDLALPYFKEVEKLDPSDRNTLIALKEIFARRNDFETSNVFKDRLEKLEAGEAIEKSHFQ